jgi:p-cumate 2,3-dioxygenase ferredoxin subunit
MTDKCLIGSVHDFPEGEIRASMLADGTVIAVYNVEGSVYVTADRCTHGEASLSDEGKLCGHLVECPWHYGTFDVTTGAPVSLPCSVPLKTYAVTIEGIEVYVQDAG